MKKHYFNKVTGKKIIIRTSYAEWTDGSGWTSTKTTFDEYEIYDVDPENIDFEVNYFDWIPENINPEIYDYDAGKDILWTREAVRIIEYESAYNYGTIEKVLATATEWESDLICKNPNAFH